MDIKKILVIRFSSIGDIVLTTPIIRCVKQQLNGVELHYVTKNAFREILGSNPHIDKIYSFNDHISELFDQLQAENYDVLIDLHKNLRSAELKRKLKVRSLTFNKINIGKYMAVNFKVFSFLPGKHIVDRYFEAVEPLRVRNDGDGLEYCIPEKDKVEIFEYHFNGLRTSFIALVLGGSYYTKKIPVEKLEEICANIKMPLILIGDKNDLPVAEKLIFAYPTAINLCGTMSINQSASVISQAEWVITPDTGMMHIAAAFNRKIISAWGNTIPEFGMSPYKPQNQNIILEVEGLNCRPCSKLGFSECPLGHFKCMREIDYGFVRDLE